MYTRLNNKGRSIKKYETFGGLLITIADIDAYQFGANNSNLEEIHRAYHFIHTHVQAPAGCVTIT
jgi:hypothetical protein